MSDIPSFEPEWNLDDPDIIGKNAYAFETIQKTISRIKLIKAVGLANLHEKGVLVKEPYCSVYDMVSAIKNIPIHSGLPRKIPDFNSKLKINDFNTFNSAVITSIPGILDAYTNLRINKMNTLQDSQANPYFVDWKQINGKEEENLSIKTIENDSIFCFVWYSILPTDEDSVMPFSLPEDWFLFKTSESLVINNQSYRTACFVKNSKSLGQEENITISNTGQKNINCCLVDFWNYTSVPAFLMEYSGLSEQTIKKDFNEPYLWIIRSVDDNDNSFLLRQDTIRKNYLFNEDIKQNMIILDRDKEGERIMNFSGTNPYSFFSLKMEEK